LVGMVGERFKRSEARPVRAGGALGSENVGLSNRKSGEIPGRRKPEVSLAMKISQGLAGPNPCPVKRGCGDGEQVNIPAPHNVSKG